MIYFLHMRKAGGTSLSGVLNQRMISGTASGQPGAFGNASFVEFLLEFMIQSGFQPATDCERVAKGSAERTAGAQCVSKAANVLGQRALRKNIFMTKVVVGGEDPSGRALGRLRHNQFPPADPRLEHAGITYFWNEGQPFIMPMLAENSFPTVSLTHLRNPVSRIISNYKMVFSACRSHEFNNSDTSAECPPPGRRSLGGWVGWRREADAECADRVESLFEYQQAWLASRKEGGAEQLSERQAFLLASLGEGLRLPKAAELVWTVVDNYYIRRLIVAGRGPDLDLPTVARLLRGQLTRADLALAKEVLQQFDVIFISDPQLGTPEEEAQFEEAIGPILFKPNADRQTIVRQSKSDRQARSVLEQFPYKSFPADGWEQKVSSFARNMARTGGRNEDPKLLQRIEKMQDVNNASVLADLARINALDMELFEYARQLVQERAAAGKDKHFLPPQPGGERTDDVPSWCDYSSRDDSARCNFRWPAEARNGAIAQSPWLVAPMGIH